jgi:phage-related protein
VADRDAPGSFAGERIVGSSLPRGRIARVIFCVEQANMVLLHGFMKKSQKTPQRDIDLALKRKNGTRT